MTAGLYVIRQLSTGRVYIGSSCRVEKRMRQHASQLSAGSHVNTYLQRAWQKAGRDDFVFEALEIIEDERERLLCETAAIARARAAERPFGFNIAIEAGRINRHFGPKTAEHRRKIAEGLTGKGHTPERRQAVSEAQRKRLASTEARMALSAINKGRKHTAETRAKVAEAGRGRTHTEETKAKTAAALRSQWADPQLRAMRLAAMQKRPAAPRVGVPLSEEHKRKIGAANKGRVHSAETRARLSAQAKQRRAPEMTPERRLKIAAAQRASWARRKVEA